MRPCPVRLLWVLLTSVGSVCACEPRPSAPVSFEVPRGRFPAFLDTPWPSDLSRDSSSGTLDLRAFPNPFGSSALDDYVGVVQSVRGYSSSGPIYFRVEGGVDELSLPESPSASVEEEASVFLIELDAPERRIPIRWRHYPEGTAFLPPGTVAVSPVLGYALRGAAALVVTSDARHETGVPLGPSADLRALLSCTPLEGVATAPDCEPYRALAAQLGRTPDDIALIQIFTVGDATRDLVRTAAWLREQSPPVARDVERIPGGVYDLYDQYRGVLDLLQFQAGTPPFSRADGVSGGFVVAAAGDAAGVAEVQGQEAVAFVLTVPRGPTPASGWPVAIVGHGTGGSLYSGLGNDARAEAFQLASAGWAMLAVSEPLHRTRRGYAAGEEELQTFNFVNPLAGRDNWRQSVLEKVQQVTFAQALEMDASERGGEAIRFDPARIGYFGHSQGGIVGAMFVALEDRIAGAFLSGAGAGFSRSLVDKTDPVVIGDLLKAFLLMPAAEPLDAYHPVLALLQTWIEPAEPLNYGANWRHRDQSFTPHLVVSAGLRDTFTPPATQAGLVGAFGLPPVGPRPRDWEVLALMGLSDVSEGSAGFLRSDRGDPLSAGVLSFAEEGHFAVYDTARGQASFRRFFDTLRQGSPVVGPE